jgi:hypothetical protein
MSADQDKLATTQYSGRGGENIGQIVREASKSKRFHFGLPGGAWSASFVQDHHGRLWDQVVTHCLANC